jgi:ribosome biogenesis protein ERB1
MKIVRAIRQGRIIPSKPKTSSDALQFYDIWSSEDKDAPSVAPPPPPRRSLPTNSESYNPPPEYLPTDEERKAWEDADPEDREKDFLPQSFDALRRVPAYDQFFKERFNRQLDLYLAPRIQKKRLNIDADSLIPKLPSPDTLRPFPVYRALRVKHAARIRSTAVSPDGHWVVTGDDSGNVKLWEVSVGYPIKTWKLPSKITAMEWCPRKDCSFFIVAWCKYYHMLFCR